MINTNNSYFGVHSMNVTIATNDEPLAEKLRIFLQNTRDTLFKRTINERFNIAEEVVNARPDVLLLDNDILVKNMDLPRDIKLKSPRVAIFVMIREQETFDDPEHIKRLMRGAVSDVFLVSGRPQFQSWLEPMRRAVEILSNIPDQENETLGKVFAVHSIKGGVGRTTITANMAALAAHESEAKSRTDTHTLVIDLNWPFGGIETLLNMRPEKSILDLLPVMNNISRQDIINASGLHETSGLRLLAAPSQSEHFSFISELLQEDITQTDYNDILDLMLEQVDRPEFELSYSNMPPVGRDILIKTIERAKYKLVVIHLVRRVIAAAKRYFDYIFVDIPPVIDEVTIAALRSADQLLLVCTPDIPSIQATRAEIEVLQKLLIDSTRINIVVNRDIEKGEIVSENIKDLFFRL